MADTTIPSPPLATPSPGAAAPVPPLTPENFESSIQDWKAAHEIHPAPPIPTVTQIETPSFKTNEWRDGVQFGVTAGFYVGLVGFVALHVLVGNLRRLTAANRSEPHHIVMARYGKIALSSIVLGLSGFLIISAHLG